ncbi:hypothetical protein V3481_018268 [Fusarium oxysporum f. sp. vasinfectum]
MPLNSGFTHLHHHINITKTKTPPSNSPVNISPLKHHKAHLPSNVILGNKNKPFPPSESVPTLASTPQLQRKTGPILRTLAPLIGHVGQANSSSHQTLIVMTAKLGCELSK